MSNTRPCFKFSGLSGDLNNARGWQITMMIYAGIASVLFFITFLTTKERVALKVTRKFCGAEFNLNIKRGVKKEIRVNGELISGSDIENIKSGQSYDIMVTL